MPLLYFFPPTTGPRASADSSPITYDFNRAGFDGDDFAEWMSNERGIAVTYSKPIPWKLLATVAATGATAAALVIFLAPKIGFFTGSKIIWEILTLGTVIVMCSGYMWNQIRGAPYSGVGAGGKVEYFAGGFQNQFVAETQIVSCICESPIIPTGAAVSKSSDPSILRTLRRAIGLLSHCPDHLRTEPERSRATTGRRLCLVCCLPRHIQPALRHL